MDKYGVPENDKLALSNEIADLSSEIVFLAKRAQEKFSAGVASEGEEMLRLISKKNEIIVRKQKELERL